MKCRHVVGFALVSIVLAAGSDAAGQSTKQQTELSARQSQPSPDATRIVQTLPQVKFGNSSHDVKGQTAFAQAVVDRARARAAVQALQARTRGNVKVICGTTVIEQSPNLDEKILMPSDLGAGAAIRKIEPTVCAADSAR